MRNHTNGATRSQLVARRTAHMCIARGKPGGRRRLIEWVVILSCWRAISIYILEHCRTRHHAVVDRVRPRKIKRFGPPRAVVQPAVGKNCAYQSGQIRPAFSEAFASWGSLHREATLFKRKSEHIKLNYYLGVVIICRKAKLISDLRGDHG